MFGLQLDQICTGLVVRVSLSRPFVPKGASPPLIEFVPSSSYGDGNLVVQEDSLLC